MDICPKCETPYKSKTSVKCSNCGAARVFKTNFCVDENCMGHFKSFPLDEDECPYCKGPTIMRKQLDELT